jgi:hypothetical protein
LEAVERLRHMIRDLSALARTRPDEFGASDCATAIRRVLGVLQPRLDHGSVEVTVDLQALEGVALPAASIEFATLSVLLGLVTSLNDAEYPPLTLSLVATTDGESGSLRLAVAARETGDGSPGISELIAPKHLQRSDAILRRGRGVASVVEDDTLEFRWLLEPGNG